MKPDEGNHKSLALWAADCAERALPAFEEKHPEDDRPRRAVEAARAWACGDGELRMTEARAAAFAAHAAARGADAAATAHVATHASYAPPTPSKPPLNTPSPVPRSATGSTAASRSTSGQRCSPNDATAEGEPQPSHPANPVRFGRRKLV